MNSIVSNGGQGINFVDPGGAASSVTASSEAMGTTCLWLATETIAGKAIKTAIC